MFTNSPCNSNDVQEDISSIENEKLRRALELLEEEELRMMRHYEERQEAYKRHIQARIALDGYLPPGFRR